MVRLLKYCLLALLACALCLLVSPTAATPPPAPPAKPQVAAPSLEEQGTALYSAGRFSEAATVLQQAIQFYQQQGDVLRQAIALSNLALVHQNLGEVTAANAALRSSLALLPPPAPSSPPNVLAIQAQIWDIQGRLQWLQGQSEQAIATWQRAAQLYTQLGDTHHWVRNQIDQSRALQSLGLHRRAITLLTGLAQQLQTQPNPLIRITGLRNLGDALRTTGDFNQSRQRLQEGLAVAQEFQPTVSDPATAGSSPSNEQAIAEAIALTQLSLGNTERAARNWQEALRYYAAASASGSLTTRSQAQLNRLNLLLRLGKITEAQQLLAAIQPSLNQIPISRAAIYARIYLAQTLMEETHETLLPDPRPRTVLIAQLLTTALEQARQLENPRLQADALGHLGHLYEQTEQWEFAEKLTRDALQLSQRVFATDITYRWQWQLGRILKQQLDSAPPQQEKRRVDEAIAVYQQAIQTLDALRLDLVSINQDEQFSFRSEVEPAYRELIELLLRFVPNQDAGDRLTDPAIQQSLRQARQTMEALQMAEVQNFFREACIDKPLELDRIVEKTSQRTDSRAATIYPIILPHQFHVILKLPDQEQLFHYASTVPQSTVDLTLKRLRQQLSQPEALFAIQSTAQQVYDWLIRRAEPLFNKTRITTLVFVLDGFLKNIPMAALYDGNKYLIETYSIALTPGLTLPDPQPLDRGQIRLLFAGLSQATQNFSPLLFVEREQAGIESVVPNVTSLNNFTAEALWSKLEASRFQVLHLATHGQFSGDREQTFVLAADRKINVNEFEQLLRTRDRTQPEPLELLVLSACRTADGDERAALGLAGVAVRAGARSTIGSLWNVDDKVGAALMTEFYRQLMQHPTLPKAEVLRRAQLSLLPHPNFGHPAYWSPYVLLGNWL